jgi:hypothetical protein
MLLKREENVYPRAAVALYLSSAPDPVEYSTLIGRHVHSWPESDMRGYIELQGYDVRGKDGGLGGLGMCPMLCLNRSLELRISSLQ